MKSMSKVWSDSKDIRKLRVKGKVNESKRRMTYQRETELNQ
jgi:hypothetical protein